MNKLVGLVQQSSVQVSVVCRVGSASGATENCEKGTVTPDTDVVEVTVRWRHIGATPYIADTLHTSVARAVINGRPDLTLLAPEADVIPPTLVSAFAYDTNTDGVMDQIKLAFSEDLTQSVTAAPFSIQNSVTGSNTIASATISARVVTLGLSGSTVNTAPGAMTVSLAASSSGVTDLWGNQASFAATTLTDAAKPVLKTVTDTNGLVAGYPNALDTLTLTFSEPIATSLGSPTIDYYRPNSGNATISIAGVTAGPLTTNSTSYNSVKNSTVSVSALTTKSGNTVVITVVSPLLCAPVGCAGLGIGSDGSAWTFSPATTLADAAGNTVTGSGTMQNLF
jgi:hypothetical protein